MIADVATTTGWTLPHVERHVCLHRLAALQRLWRRSPPLQVMVQAYLGIEGEEIADPSLPSMPLTAAEEEAAITAFARNFAAAGGAVH